MMTRWVKTGLLLVIALGVLLPGIVSAGTIKGKVTAKRKKYLPHTIVYVDSVPGTFKPPKKHVVMNQKDLTFVPHVLPILVGTTVDFRNEDDVAHNVFTPDKSANKFNLGTWPKGEIRSYTFKKRCDKVCEAVMLCNVHPEMEAFVGIMQNPYFTTADDSGNFEISDVPTGTFDVKVWNPKLASPPQSVAVPDSGVVKLTFDLKKKKKK